MAPDFLMSWFHRIAEEILQSGSPAEITSGLACVHYNLAETTKDCDIWIPSASLAMFRKIVIERTWQNSHCVYRSPLSSPLDVRWLEGGWSAHVIWGGPPQAQVDVFGRLPRVIHHQTSGTFSDEETLARVKMTQREKDWTTVHLLGDRILKKNNPKGLLFLQSVEDLLEARENTEAQAWNAQAALRPLLRWLTPSESSAMLEAGVRIERTFWQKVDNLRLAEYRKAGKEYSRRSIEILKKNPTFLDQDGALTELAESALPTHPLKGQANRIVSLAVDHAMAGVDRSQIPPSLLPTEWARATLDAIS